MNLSLTPQQVLRDIFIRNPRAPLHEIRNAHPALRGMSLDHLALRLNRLIDSAADARAK